MIIDTHFHAFPGKYLELVPEQSKNDVRGVGYRPFDPREYLEVMDRYGVDVGVLSNTGSRIEGGGNQERAMQLCRVINDCFAEAHAKHPRRFMAFARLPMLSTDDCLKEMRRCFDELGMHGIVVSTNLAGKYLDEPEFKPFWEEAAKLGKPVFLHPANAPCQSNWNKYSLHQKILWPTDSTLALSRLVYSGIFDRHPGLNLIASHLGGMILNYLDRLNWREGRPECRRDPEDYFKMIYYDTAGPVRTAFIKLVCDTVGTDHVLFGSDYPHGRGGRDDQFYPMTLKAMEDLDVSKEGKEQIFFRNAQRLFGIDN